MDAKISPRPLSGKVRAIPSKSDTHRKLICAALSGAPSKLELGAPADISAAGGLSADISASAVTPSSAFCLSADISATVGALSALGAEIVPEGSALRITPVQRRGGVPVLNCCESGSTLRSLLPVAAALYDHASFKGAGRLPERPLKQLMEAMGANGVSFSSLRLPFETNGLLRPGSFCLPGNVSSQYITGLMLALPLLAEQSEICLTTPLESAGYVELTISVLRSYGVAVQKTPGGWSVPGGQSYKAPSAVTAEGDWTNAAFFLCAGALGRPVTVTGLDLGSTQGDREILNILSRFGAEVKAEGGSITVSPAQLTGCELDMREIPDLLPVLAVLAACAQGETRFINASRLRLKESDRLAATAAMLNTLGAEVTELPDGLAVSGGALTGGTVQSFGDHRMAMAAAIAAIRCSEPVTILGAEAVSKSYPAFFDHYAALGGEVCVL